MSRERLKGSSRNFGTYHIPTLKGFVRCPLCKYLSRPGALFDILVYMYIMVLKLQCFMKLWLFFKANYILIILQIVILRKFMLRQFRKMNEIVCSQLLLCMSYQQCYLSKYKFIQNQLFLYFLPAQIFIYCSFIYYDVCPLIV